MTIAKQFCRNFTTWEPLTILGPSLLPCVMYLSLEVTGRTQVSHLKFPSKVTFANTLRHVYWASLASLTASWCLPLQCSSKFIVLRAYLHHSFICLCIISCIDRSLAPACLRVAGVVQKKHWPEESVLGLTFGAFFLKVTDMFLASQRINDCFTYWMSWGGCGWCGWLWWSVVRSVVGIVPTIGPGSKIMFSLGGGTCRCFQRPAIVYGWGYYGWWPYNASEDEAYCVLHLSCCSVCFYQGV